MTSDEAIDRLRKHAGFGEPDKALLDIALVLFEFRRGGSLDHLERVTENIVECLDAINALVNPNPEASPPEQGTQAIPAAVIAAISQVCFDCLDAAISTGDDASRTQLLTAAWKVECAWNAVVAGDISSIVEHLKVVAEARVKYGHPQRPRIG